MGPALPGARGGQRRRGAREGEDWAARTSLGAGAEARASLSSRIDKALMRSWPRPAPPPARGGGEWRPRTGFSAARLPAGTARPTRPASALPHTARSLSCGPEPPSCPTPTGLGSSILTSQF